MKTLTKELKERAIVTCNGLINGEIKKITKQMLEEDLPILLAMAQDVAAPSAVQTVYASWGSGFKCPICNNEDIDERDKHCCGCGTKLIFDLDSMNSNHLSTLERKFVDKVAVVCSGMGATNEQIVRVSIRCAKYYVPSIITEKQIIECYCTLGYNRK